MTRLLLDLGNSRLKAAWQTGDTYCLLPVSQVEDMPGLVISKASDIWLSSVVDADKTQKLIGALPNTVNLHQVSVVNYLHHLPTHYQPEQLGVDRWLGLLACYSMSSKPCLVVDCGTTITLDTVNAQGEHTGGYILPGLHMMQRSILEGTAIDWVTSYQPMQSKALDSTSAIALGARHALTALIEKMLYQAGKNAQLFIGGGAAGELMPYLVPSFTQVEFMVLEGLSCLANLEAS